MDNTPKKDIDLRFIGIDLGNSSARLARTIYNPGIDQFQTPVTRPFDGNPCLPVLLISHPGGAQTITKRRDIPKLTSQSADTPVIERDFLLQLEKVPDDSRLRQKIRVIADKLYRELVNWMGLSNFDRTLHLVTLSLPAKWAIESTQALALQSIFEEAGFADIQVMPDAVAAVLYHLHAAENNLPYHGAQTQRWLVIDVGGSSTRFTSVEKQAGGSDLKICGTFQEEWGGDLIDEALFNGFILPMVPSSALPVDNNKKAIILQMICGLKEKFSNQVESAGLASVNFLVEGIQDPVELTREMFETDQVCKGLIDEFHSLLLDERLTNDPAFQGFEQVVLTGGGANWYFVKKAVEQAWSGRCVRDKKPEEATVKGLALARTGFEPQEAPEIEQIVAVVEEETVSEIQQPVQGIEQPVITALANINGRQGPGTGYPIVGRFTQGETSTVHGRNEASTWWYIQNPAVPGGYIWVIAERIQIAGDTSQVPVRQIPVSTDERAPKSMGDKYQGARRLILICALVGAGIALLLSPFPGMSWPFLMGLEIFMLVRIAVTYWGLKINSSSVILMVVGLLIVSTILTLVIGEIIGTLAWLIGMGWLIKAVVAALVIWGLGEGAIKILDKIVAAEQSK